MVLPRIVRLNSECLRAEYGRDGGATIRITASVPFIFKMGTPRRGVHTAKSVARFYGTQFAAKAFQVASLNAGATTRGR